MNKGNRFAAAVLLALAVGLQGCATTGAPDSQGIAAPATPATPDTATRPIHPDEPSEDICARGWLAPQVTFAPGSASLVPCSIRVLNEAVETLSKHPDLKIEVAGHIDALEAQSDGPALAERRAQVVYDYLIEKGVSTAQLVGPVGYGDERPIVPEPLDKKRRDAAYFRENRRVELNVQN